jgi:hypothetical protein
MRSLCVTIHKCLNVIRRKRWADEVFRTRGGPFKHSVDRSVGWSDRLRFLLARPVLEVSAPPHNVASQSSTRPAH